MAGLDEHEALCPVLADVLDGAAEWADDRLAGGAPPKTLLHLLIAANREIAAALRGQDWNGEVRAAPAETDARDVRREQYPYSNNPCDQRPSTGRWS